MEGFYTMMSYVRQVPICKSVRKAIEESFAESGNASFRAKIGDIPTVESILRAVSLYPNLNNAEELRTFMVKHILSDLRLTVSRRRRHGTCPVLPVDFSGSRCRKLPRGIGQRKSHLHPRLDLPPDRCRLSQPGLSFAGATRQSSHAALSRS